MSRVAKEREALEKAQAQAVGFVHRLGKKVARAERREDSRGTRRKIVSGAAILTMVRKDPALRARFGSFLQTFVTRQADRVALELDEPETFLDRDAREAAAALQQDEISRALSVLEPVTNRASAEGERAPASSGKPSRSGSPPPANGATPARSAGESGSSATTTST